MIINEIKNLFSYPKMLLSSSVKIFSTPKLLFYAIIPYCLSLIAFYFIFRYGTGHIDAIIGYFTDAETGFLYWLLYITSFLIICVFSGAITFVVVLVLGGFFIDLIIESLLVSSNIITKEEMSFEKFVSQNFQSIKADVCVAIVLFLCALFSFLLGFIPFISIIPILVGVLTLGLSLFDRVLSVSLLTLEDRKSFLKSNLVKVFFVGFFATIILCIPFINMFLTLPLLAMTTQIYCDKENNEKENFMNEIEKQSSDSNSDNNNNEQLN